MSEPRNVLVAAPLVLAALVVGCKDEPAGGAQAMASAAAAKWAASASAPVPPPPPPEKPHERTILSHLHQPKGMAHAGDYLYVVDSVGGDKEKQNEVLDLVRVSAKAEDAKSELRLVQKQRGLGSPVVVKDDVYFTVAGDRPGEDRLVKMPTSGGAMTTLATKVISQAFPAIATDGTSLYYLGVVGNAAKADAGGGKMDVMRLAIAGGKPQKLATVDRSARLLFVVADAHDVYFPEAARIARVPVAGGEESEVLKVVYAWAAISDGQSLYVSDSPGDGMGTVRRAPVAAGAPPTSNLASGFSFPVSLALSDKALYFVNFDAQDGGVFRVGATGGSAIPLVQGQKHPASVLVDGGAVYWTNTAEGTVCRTDP